MARTIDLHPHNPSWADLYHLEAEKFASIFAQQLVSIHHIGSTAIPKIKAKPVIDILVVVRDINTIPGIIPEMESLGYIYRDEAGIPGRQFFRKDTDGVRSHHIHIYQDRNPDIARHLNFRDYFIAHPVQALAYSRLKEELALKFRDSPPEYTEAKSEFINQTNQLAAEWQKTLNN